MTARRWPRRVYGSGEEPDYRFSLANERTFMAWIRTALAFLVAGLAVDLVDLELSHLERMLLSVTLVGVGLVLPVVAWWRWAAAERAMRHGAALPAFGASVAVSVALTATALVVAGEIVSR